MRVLLSSCGVVDGDLLVLVVHEEGLHSTFLTRRAVINDEAEEVRFVDLHCSKVERGFVAILARSAPHQLL